MAWWSVCAWDEDDAYATREWMNATYADHGNFCQQYLGDMRELPRFLICRREHVQM
eukprot:gene10115-6563_t